jgi:SAM-dependent methyltransferase
LGGRTPWSVGYAEVKERKLRSVLRSRSTLDIFRDGGSLPRGFGFGLDERIVEYPWLIGRLGSGTGKRFLDAGCVLNQPDLLALPELSGRRTVLCTLVPEVPLGSSAAYVWGDLRSLPFCEGSFDDVACISTLEHVGMDQTVVYSFNPRLRESRDDDYLDAVRELKRVLRPGGRLLLTVPYGCYQNLGWFQQFDRARVESVVDAFDGTDSRVRHYRYRPSGWELATADLCDDARYFDVNAGPEAGADRAAAARAVACLELRK